MTPFECYKLYLVLKLHMTKDNYDYFLNQGRSSATEESFSKRKDKFRFMALSKEFTSSEIRDIMLANLIVDQKWTLFDSKTNARYKEFKARKAARLYHFENEIRDFYNSGADPLEAYIRGDLSIDSFVILDRIKPMFDDIAKDSLSKELIKVPQKYSPFVKVELENFVELERKVAAETEINKPQ